MMNINDLKQKKAALLNEAVTLTKRQSFGEEEKVKVDSLIAEIEGVESRIKVLQKEEDVEMESIQKEGDNRSASQTETSFRGAEVETFQVPHFHIRKPAPGLGKILRYMKDGRDVRELGASSDATGGVTTPAPLMREIIQSLQDESVILKAGAKVYSLTSDTNTLAKITRPASSHWRPENTLIENISPAFDKATFSPKTCASIIPVANELLQDALNLEGALRQMFVRAFAAELDRVAFLGEAASNEPVGISQWTGLAHVNDYGTSPLINTGAYFPIGYIISKIMAEKSPQPNAIITSPQVITGLEVLQDSTYQPLNKPGLINSMSWLSCSELAGESTSTMFIGHFASLAVGIRSELTIRMLDQRYSDKYQTGFLAVMRVDVQPLWEQSFGMIQNIGHPLEAHS